MNKIGVPLESLGDIKILDKEDKCIKEKLKNFCTSITCLCFGNQVYLDILSSVIMPITDCPKCKNGTIRMAHLIIINLFKKTILRLLYICIGCETVYSVSDVREYSMRQVIAYVRGSRSN